MGVPALCSPRDPPHSLSMRWIRCSGFHCWTQQHPKGQDAFSFVVFSEPVFDAFWLCCLKRHGDHRSYCGVSLQKRIRVLNKTYNNDRGCSSVRRVLPWRAGSPGHPWAAWGVRGQPDPVRIHVKVVMTGFYLSSLTSHLKCLPLATWEPVKCDC